MDIECGYYDSDNIYCCTVINHRILDDTKLKFIGKHKDGKTDNDVQLIVFAKCIISKVPQGLTEKFPNLRGLQIYNSGLKDINRSDLLEYKSFRWLFLNCNNIEYLPGDLFADCKRLTQIELQENPLTTVEPNILNGLECLIQVNFSGKNINYGKIDSNSIISRDDPKLLEMKVKLYEEYMKTANSKLKTDFVKNICKDNEKHTKFKAFFKTDEVLKDFRINISGKQFRVHKIFLAARSSYLADILRKTPQSKCLKLTDISADIFEHILTFLYTDELPKEANFVELFTAAERFRIDELKEYAAEKILEQLDHENAPEVLSLGSKYKHDEIKRKAFQKIKRKYPEIELKEEWLNQDEKIEKVVEHLQKIRKIEQDLANSMEDD